MFFLFEVPFDRIIANRFFYMCITDPSINYKKLSLIYLSERYNRGLRSSDARNCIFFSEMVGISRFSRS